MITGTFGEGTGELDNSLLGFDVLASGTSLSVIESSDLEFLLNTESLDSSRAIYKASVPLSSCRLLSSLLHTTSVSMVCNGFVSLKGRTLLK